MTQDPLRSPPLKADAMLRAQIPPALHSICAGPRYSRSLPTFLTVSLSWPNTGVTSLLWASSSSLPNAWSVSSASRGVRRITGVTASRVSAALSENAGSR